MSVDFVTQSIITFCVLVALFYLRMSYYKFKEKITNKKIKDLQGKEKDLKGGDKKNGKRKKTTKINP